MKKFEIHVGLLDDMVTEFIQTAEDTPPKTNISEEWDAKDALCHIVFWHEYYVKNWEAESRGEKHILTGKYYEITPKGITKLKPNSTEKLIKRLKTAQRKLKKVLLSGAVTKMTYKEGSRDYEVDEFCETVTRHIGSHMKQIKKAKRKLERESKKN